MPRETAPAARGPSGQIEEALRRLRRGDLEAAMRLATGALGAAQARKDSTNTMVAGVAHETLAEVHFRLAVRESDAGVSLRHLDEALGHAPGSSKLRFYRALALWQLGRLGEALGELDAVYRVEPQRPRLAFLRQLVRLAAGQPMEARVAQGLAPDEGNTLRVVAEFMARRPGTPASAGLPEPLLGKGSAMWAALLSMHRDPAGAPVAALGAAAEANPRKPVGKILRYYHGVAAARAGDQVAAVTAWHAARQAGLETPWLRQNLLAQLQEQVQAAAGVGRWQDVIAIANRIPSLADDRSLAEIVGLAHYHLGYAAGEAGRWPVAVKHWQSAAALAGSRYLAQNLALAEEAQGHWSQAAEAWREMVRRRPRKEDHPDFLSQAQVAAIWDHIAECYGRAGEAGHALATLKTASQYVPDNVDQRLKLVDALVDEDRDEAARNELDRIIERSPDHEGALMRLAALQKRGWGEDPMPTWRRVLAANPENAEAREELVEAYLEDTEEDSVDRPRFPFFRRRAEKSHIQLLQQALQEIPGHPALLARLGAVYGRAGKNREARAHLLQAYAAAPEDVKVAGEVLHELLHVGAGDEVQKLVPAVSEIRGLLPEFWINQGRLALGCNLGETWAERFFAEASGLVGRPWVDDSLAGVLLGASEAAFEEEAKALAQRYEERLRAEAPASGALEYLAAHRLFRESRDVPEALKLLRKAIRMARKAGDPGVLKRAEEVEKHLSHPLASLAEMLDAMK